MQPRPRVAWPFGVVVLALAAGGCLPSISDLNAGPLTSSFAVSDYFAPSGYMGDGAYFGNLLGQTNEGCKPRPDGARGNCYAFTYYPNAIDTDPWAGVFWVFPSNSWGASSGYAIDISKFSQVSFYAAVDGPSPFTVRTQPVPFSGQAGGIDPKGEYANKGETDYVDGVANAFVDPSANVGTGPDDVTTDLKQFHIPLGALQKTSGCVLPGTANKAVNCSGDVADAMGNATFVIGAFAWALHYPIDSAACRDPSVDCHADNSHSSQFVNPQPVHIYIDDIVWE
jgi:hypothetical protein